MATIDSKDVIDALIKNNGYYDDDPRAFMIVEYTNAYGNQTWGVTWVNETGKYRYLEETPFVRNPKVIWMANPGSKK
jgi:hypothetical protein